jgi:hypothetical protein
MTCRFTEYQAIMTGIGAFCVLGVISSLGPAGARFVDLVFTVLVIAVMVAPVVAAVRRELRIRRRLAAIRPRPPEQRDERRRAMSGGSQ